MDSLEIGWMGGGRGEKKGVLGGILGEMLEHPEASAASRGETSS